MEYKSLTISSWNIQGLRSTALGIKSRTPDFSKEIADIDIIVLQETWHRGENPTGRPTGYIELLIPSTKLVGVTQGRDSGGMLIWYKAELTNSIKLVKTGVSSIWLQINKELTKTEKDVFLGAPYIPPLEFPYFKEDMFSALEEEISYFQARGHIVVCGDLNARTGREQDTLNTQGNKHLPGGENISSPPCPPRHNHDKVTNKHGTQLIQLCRSLGLYIVNGRLRGDSFGRYTYSSPLGNSTVDYFITDLNLAAIRAFTVSPQTPLSDHNRTTAYLNRSTQNHKEQTPNKLHTIRKRYKWKGHSIEEYQNAIRQIKVQSRLDQFLKRTFQKNKESVDSAVETINNIFDLTASLANLKIQNRRARKNNENDKWYDNDCKNLRKELRKLSNQKHRDPDNENTRLQYWEKLKQYKNTVRQKRDQHTRNQLQIIEDSIQTNSFWENWNKLNKPKQDELPIQNGDIWVNHFSSLFGPIESNKEQKQIQDKLKNLESAIKDYQNPLDSQITLKELQDNINTLKTKKACGADGILNEMIKFTDHKFQLAILKLFNIVLSSGTFPNTWNQGLITPLHKSGDKYDPNNYRGICVNSNLGKVLCMIINHRILTFLTERNTLSKSQIGFLPNHRTTDHIYTLNTLIDNQINKNKSKLFSCFVDFKKAFDSIWHEGLMYKLLESGIGGKTYDIIKSMYTNNKCAVKIDGKHTDFFPQSRGVRQGCSLSPTLFNIYIDELTKMLEQSTAPGITLTNTEVKCLLFADDLLLLSPTKEGLQQQLDLLHKFSQTWALTVNLTKTKIMIFQKRSSHQKQQFFLNTTPLEQTKNYTYLGLNISSTGNFNQAVKDLRDKARRAFYAIKRNIKLDIPIKTWNKILDSVIEPISLYGCEIWGPLANQDLEKWDKHQTETLHTEFCKSILRTQRKTPNNACRAELGRYPLIIKIKKRALKFYNHIKESDPGVLHNKALAHRETLDRCPLSQMVRELSAQTTPPPNRKPTRLNQIIKQQKESYLTYWKETTQKQSKLECYLALNREYTMAEYLSTVTDPKQRKTLTRYRLSEHSLAIEKGRHRQTWLPREERLCPHCTQNEVETELHFLTACPLYQDIRDTYFPQITNTQGEFENMSNEERLPYLLGEVQQCANTAASFVSCCDRRRTTKNEQTPLKTANHGVVLSNTGT